MQISPFQFEHHDVRVVADEAGEPLPAAEGFVRLLDTGKRHGGAMAQQLKWADNVLQLVQPEAA